MPEPIDVLISLHRGYGLGDAVQMSAVLRHVAAYRPWWRVDFQAEAGRECVGRGIARNVFVYGQPYPTEHYDAEVQLLLYDTWHRYVDRPNTRVSSVLKECLGLDWRADCGRYRIEVSLPVKMWAGDTIGPRMVAFHYEGVTARDKKDLTDEQANAVCQCIYDLDRSPYMLGYVPKGYNAEVNCAAIAECEAFVGIDSGPAKCASATDTPSLVVWTGHHPAPFHDPAPNTTHLVPLGYHSMSPVCNDREVIEWFEANYNIRYYCGDPVPEVANWLREVLK